MMTMMMMMIDDMLSPYMYLPDVPAFRLLSALVCIGSCSQCSCLGIEKARKRSTMSVHAVGIAHRTADALA